MSSLPPLSIIPGRQYILPLQVLDDMGQNVTQIIVFQSNISVLGVLIDNNVNSGLANSIFLTTLVDFHVCCIKSSFATSCNNNAYILYYNVGFPEELFNHDGIQDNNNRNVHNKEYTTANCVQLLSSIKDDIMCLSVYQHTLICFNSDVIFSVGGALCRMDSNYKYNIVGKL